MPNACCCNNNCLISDIINLIIYLTILQSILCCGGHGGHGGRGIPVV